MTSQLPEGKVTKVVPPQPNSSASERRQTVVWLAQDVYAAELEQVKTLDDQLRLIQIWKELLSTINCKDGLMRMNVLLSKAWSQGVSEMPAYAGVSKSPG